jgi:hypothetical protein
MLVKSGNLESKSSTQLLSTIVVSRSDLFICIRRQVTSAPAVSSSERHLSLQDVVRLNKEEAKKYLEMRRQGVDEVSHTEEAAAMRNYQLRKKKPIGWRKKEAALADVLFPGVLARIN